MGDIDCGLVACNLIKLAVNLRFGYRVTRVGKWIFAFGAGLITVLIRFYGSYPEGVSFAILFMNIISPYIEKWTAKMPLGGKK